MKKLNFLLMILFVLIGSSAFAKEYAIWYATHVESNDNPLEQSFVITATEIEFIDNFVKLSGTMRYSEASRDTEFSRVLSDMKFAEKAKRCSDEAIYLNSQFIYAIREF